jgi:hypothetical protein
MSYQTVEWQDIETAPKDGSDILVFVPEHREQYVAWWSRVHTCWLWADTEHSTEACEPTHWTPLPEPPKAETVTVSVTEPRTMESFLTRWERVMAATPRT